MDGFRHSLQLHKYPGFKLFLLWYYLVVGESGFLGGRIQSAQPTSMIGRRRAVKLGLSRPWNICQAVCLYFIAWRCIEWNPHRGHSTTLWTNFDNLPPRVNFCGHSADSHLLSTCPRSYWMPPYAIQYSDAFLTTSVHFCSYLQQVTSSFAYTFGFVTWFWHCNLWLSYVNMQKSDRRLLINWMALKDFCLQSNILYLLPLSFGKCLSLESEKRPNTKK